MSELLLFDFDGVVIDSEKYYTLFWDEIGEEYLGRSEFCAEIKGCTLESIFATYFDASAQAAIEERLDRFEAEMPLEYIPGAVDFIKDARERGCRAAVVTSSSTKKMNNVYNRLPEITGMFDIIFSSKDFSESKPSPQCYLMAMSYFGAAPENTIVFEDSVKGLMSGKDSGALLVGLSTTNPAEIVGKYADYVIEDFTGHRYDEFLK